MNQHQNFISKRKLLVAATDEAFGKSPPLTARVSPTHLASHKRSPGMLDSS
jgi:hypothetical protein